MVFRTFRENLFEKLYADRGYISRSLFEMMWNEDVHIITGLRANMRNRLVAAWDKIKLRKRLIIETINDQLKMCAKLCTQGTGAWTTSSSTCWRH